MTDRPPLPPFDLESALAKVQAAEDAWNTRDPERVAGAYTVDSVWRNRDTFVTGRAAIIEFLAGKWRRELDYALRKNLWGFRQNRIAVRFQYECHDAQGQWWRSYGNELWEFDEHGLMRRREASINDIPIEVSQRRIFGPRPAAERGAEFPIQLPPRDQPGGISFSGRRARPGGWRPTGPPAPWGERWRRVHPRYVTHLGPDASSIGPPPAGDGTAG